MDGCFAHTVANRRWQTGWLLWADSRADALAAGEITSPVAVDFADRPDGSFHRNRISRSAYHDVRIGMFMPAALRRVAVAAARVAHLSRCRHGPRNLADGANAVATDRSTNLAQRVYLAQRWTDLLELEGFVFALPPGRSRMRIYRRHWCGRVNTALRAKDPGLADRLLDDYLNKLDAVSDNGLPTARRAISGQSNGKR